MDESTSVVAALWDEYQRDRSRDVRDRLILNYSPLVKFVAGRVAAGLPHNIEQSDLVSYGMFGLIDAIDKFDPARGFKFETYAISRIKGAIIDELRSIDWVPRSVHSKARKIQLAMQEVEQRHGRMPTDQEVARELNLPVAEFHRWLNDVRPATFVCLDAAQNADADDDADHHRQAAQNAELTNLTRKRNKFGIPAENRLISTYYIDAYG